MQRSNCNENVPKSFYPISKENINGYLVYTWRNDGKIFLSKVRVHLNKMTNKRVIPYNPYLNRKFQVFETGKYVFEI